jgi:hypothetical protein
MLQRPSDRLARLCLGRARDAAGVDDVEVGVVFRDFLVPSLQQGAASDHRVSLRDLAAEELNGKAHGYSG